MKDNPFNIVLYQPDIPQNTGSLIRLCACTGVRLHIIEPCGFLLDDKKLKRVAMDYGSDTEIIRHSSWESFENRRRQEGTRLVLLTTRATTNYTDFAFRQGDMLLLGRESSGVPDDVRAAADVHLRIPLAPSARSLNVAMAAGMVLGEALRQTKGWPHAA